MTRSAGAEPQRSGCSNEAAGPAAWAAAAKWFYNGIWTDHFAMTGPSGVQNPGFGGTYLEIVPDKKIVYTNGFEAPGSEQMVVTRVSRPPTSRPDSRS